MPVRWRREDALALSDVVSAGMARRVAKSGGGRNAWPLATALAASMGLVLWFDRMGWTPPGALPWLGMAALLSLALGAVGQALDARRILRRGVALSFDVSPHVHGPQEAVLDAAGVSFASPDGSRSHHPWGAVRAVTRQGGLLLLWLDPDRPLAIPEHALAPGQAESLHAMAQARKRGVPIVG